MNATDRSYENIVKIMLAKVVACSSNPVQMYLSGHYSVKGIYIKVLEKLKS